MKLLKHSLRNNEMTNMWRVKESAENAGALIGLFLPHRSRCLRYVLALVRW